MLILVNTDRNIEGTEVLTARIREAVALALDHFSTHITRVEVHLSDENGAKENGSKDTRCMLEVRLEGRPPVAVTEHALTVDQAVHGATGKVTRLLESTLGRLRETVHQEHRLPDADG